MNGVPKGQKQHPEAQVVGHREGRLPCDTYMMFQVGVSDAT